MKYIMTIALLVMGFLATLGSIATASLSSSAAVSVTRETVESWPENYPRAASDLGAWVNTFPAAARALFKWDATYPEQTRIFVYWVDTHQGRGIDVFSEQHTDWQRFHGIIKAHRPALRAFVVWCRFHPKASMALMQHPRALQWVGRHLYEPAPGVKGE